MQTDRFAAMVGLNLRVIPRMSPGRRKRAIAKLLLEPAEMLRDNLERHGELVELNNAVRLSTRATIHQLETQLSAFIEVAKATSEQIAVRKGARWDTDFKRYYVRTVTMLCEFLNNSFEPTRLVDKQGEGSSAFQSAVDILARPLTFRENVGTVATFDGAIREMVDTWNKNKRAMLLGSDDAAKSMEKHSRR